MLLTVLSLIFPVVMVLAMVSDFRHFEIPNGLSLVILSAYPLAAIIGGLPWQTILLAFALGALVLIVMMIAFVFGVMGGGDCKLQVGDAVVYFNNEIQHSEVLLVKIPVSSSGVLRSWRNALARELQRGRRQPEKLLPAKATPMLEA